MSNPRKKGARNERKVSNLLQDWSGYEFARTPQSGGLHWRKQYTCGDIVCIDDEYGAKFPFSIECKFHEEFDLLHLIDNTIGKKSNKIMSFWQQSKGDALPYGKIPLVFMRRNGMKKDMHFVIMPTYFYQTWLERIGEWDNEYGVFIFHDKTEDFVIMNSEDLMKTEYEQFYLNGRKLYRFNKKQLKTEEDDKKD